MLVGWETLSEGFARYGRNPWKRAAIILLGVSTVKHLYFPEFLKEIDPFGILALIVRIVSPSNEVQDAHENSTPTGTADPAILRSAWRTWHLEAN